MIKVTNIQTSGWEAAIRGMRNPMNSWDKSDGGYCGHMACGQCPLYKGDCSYSEGTDDYIVGPNDLSLMLKLVKAGSDHAKFRRMITVTMDILAPLYWWKEFDTYKVGTVANSTSTMHTIHAKEFMLDDFSHEHLDNDESNYYSYEAEELLSSTDILRIVVGALNQYRKLYLQFGDKSYWWQMIQLLPTSYNQLRTVQLNYEVLANIYHARNEHKLDEWRELCQIIKRLPYSEIITLEEDE